MNLECVVNLIKPGVISLDFTLAWGRSQLEPIGLHVDPSLWIHPVDDSDASFAPVVSGLGNFAGSTIRTVQPNVQQKFPFSILAGCFTNGIIFRQSRGFFGPSIVQNIYGFSLEYKLADSFNMITANCRLCDIPLPKTWLLEHEINFNATIAERSEKPMKCDIFSLSNLTFQETKILIAKGMKRCQERTPPT
jgi:hypothetical protein